jgi:hypothetical protein
VFPLKSLAYILGLAVLFAGGWWLYITRDARARDNADALVMMFRDDGVCTIQQLSKNAAAKVPCGDVGHYLRDTLKLRVGSTISIGVSLTTGESSIGALAAVIAHEGYKTVGVMRVGITDPDR